MLHSAMIWMLLLGLMNFVRSHMAVIAARHERDANEVTNHLTQLQQQASCSPGIHHAWTLNKL